MSEREQGRRATVAIVGGGPGGLMAAEVLATAGLAVTLYDAMSSVGRKLLLAGRGGLNLTHSEAPVRMLARYGTAAPRLRSALEEFSPADLRSWCDGLGEPTFVGSSGRVFPESFRANRLLEAWTTRLEELGVEIRTGHRWTGWLDEPPPGGIRISGPNGTEPVRPDAVVLALGGASWPGTGSDGSWVGLFEAIGIAVTPLRPANSGVEVGWTPLFAERFAGTPIKNVGVRCAGESTRGELMVTESGLEGGAVYALSRSLHDEIDRVGGAVLRVDLCPDLDRSAVLARLDRRRPRDSLSTVLRRHLGLQPVSVGLLREATANTLPSESAALADLVHDAQVQVGGSAPLDRAISTAGGIRLDEVDDDFMLRRRPGTWVVGEMLDWEAPTGGFLLQATFATAVAAARGVMLRLAPSVAQRAQHHELW